MKKTNYLLLTMFLLCIPIQGQVNLKTFLDNFNWNSTTEELMKKYDGHITPVTKEGKNPTTVLVIDSIPLEDYLCPVELWRKGDKVQKMTINTELMKVKPGIQDPLKIDDALNAIFPKQVDHVYRDPHWRDIAKVFEGDMPENFTKWFSKNYSIRLKADMFGLSPLVIDIQHQHNSPYDFRKGHWGELEDTVMSREKEHLNDDKTTMGNYVIYTFDDKFEGMPCLVGYHFKYQRFHQGELLKGKYLITKKFSSIDEYIEHFNKLVQIMRDRYGSARIFEDSSKNKVYQWENYNSFIYVALTNKVNDKNKLYLEVTYSDKAAEGDYKRRFGRRDDPDSPFTRY